MDDPVITLELRQQQDYRFEVRFDGTTLAPLHTDEPPPLGGGTGPDPARLLGAAVANCLSASLLFALRKYKNEPQPLRAACTVRKGRNEQNRLRIAAIEVDLHLGVDAAALKTADRALAQFEDFCVVTQTVRGGVPVHVRVFDSAGTLLHSA